MSIFHSLIRRNKTLSSVVFSFKRNYEKRKAVLNENGIFSYLTNSKGYILILVISVMTLLVSISGEFIAATQTNIGYIRKLQNRLRASYLAKSGVELSKYILYADSKGLSSEMLTGKATNKNIDCYNDVWAIDMPPVPLEAGDVKIQIIDENSKINLSVVANEVTDRTKFYFMTQTFFINMGLPMDTADIIHDWVDIDDSRMPYGAETSDFYSTAIPAYTAKNNSMDSIDELLMMKGITPEIFYGLGGGNFGLEQGLVDHNKGSITLDLDKLSEMSDKTRRELEESEDDDELQKIGKEKSRKLSDYFTVYGDRRDYSSDFNKININTAPYRVLSALTDNMTPDIVTEIISRRLSKPFTSVSEINDLIEDTTITDRLSVKSYIFRIIATATVGNAVVRINAVYNRGTRKIVYWCEE